MSPILAQVIPDDLRYKKGSHFNFAVENSIYLKEACYLACRRIRNLLYRIVKRVNVFSAQNALRVLIT